MKIWIQEAMRQIRQWPFEKAALWGVVLLFAVFGWTSIYIHESNLDKLYMTKGQETSEFIRWHFLAHSDAQEDQSIKRQVRDAVMTEAVDWFAEASSIEECRNILIQSLPKIQTIAEDTLRVLEAPYSVSIYYGPAYFSDRQLNQSSFAGKEGVLRAGQYDAIRLVIGAGAGHNWWCLLFPPLSVGSQVVFEVPPQTDEKELALKTTRSPLMKAGDSEETAKNKKDNQNSQLPVKPRFKLLEIIKGEN